LQFRIKSRHRGATKRPNWVEVPLVLL